jgi:hypothetical protein
MGKMDEVNLSFTYTVQAQVQARALMILGNNFLHEHLDR